MENNPRGIKIAQISNIPIFIDPSWLLITLLFAFSLQQLYRELLPQWSWPIGIGVSVLYFASILFHELAHSWTAQQADIKVNFVVLHFFGGLASLDREPASPGIEARVAAAGPLANFALGIIALGLLYPIVGENLFDLLDQNALENLIATKQPLAISVAIVLYRIAYLNIFVGLINLLPGLPLDGGRLFRALMWQICRSKHQGTVMAARSGQILGWFFIIRGIFILFGTGNLIALFWMLTGIMFLRESIQVLNLAEMEAALLKINAEVTMTRDFRLVDGATTLRDFADNFLLREQSPLKPIYFASRDGRDRGWIDPQKLTEIKSDRWSQESVEAITAPLKSLTTVNLSTPLAQVISALETEKLRWIAVLSPVGSVAGVIDRGDILRALSKMLRWQLPEDFIQKVKQEGVFPPMLPIGEISARLKDS